MDPMETLEKNRLAVPVLELPRSEGYMTVDTDLCDNQIGCVLCQDQTDGAMKPERYWSRVLNAAEQNYDTMHCECLDVAWAIFLLRHFLEVPRF